MVLKKTGSRNGFTYFNRGSFFGGFFNEFPKVRLIVKEPRDGLSEITLEDGWYAAYDRGDIWILITELANKLEKA